MPNWKSDNSPVHAFVAGCVWGDDSSWKIQYIDVSRIDEGIIKRDERFGYIELPEATTLKKAIRIDDLEDNGHRITIAVNLQFDINTGEVSMWDQDLYDKIVAGRKRVEENDKKWDGFNDRQAAHDADMQERWTEQGEEIRREIEGKGGKIS